MLLSSQLAGVVPAALPDSARVAVAAFVVALAVFRPWTAPGPAAAVRPRPTSPGYPLRPPSIARPGRWSGGADLSPAGAPEGGRAGEGGARRENSAVSTADENTAFTAFAGFEAAGGEKSRARSASGGAARLIVGSAAATGEFHEARRHHQN